MQPFERRNRMEENLYRPTGTKHCNIISAGRKKIARAPDPINFLVSNSLTINAN